MDAALIECPRCGTRGYFIHGLCWSCREVEKQERERQEVTR